MRYCIRLAGFLFFFLGMFLSAHAQQKHFIYIQSEDKQPFAVVLDGKVYSSSDEGYVIVPKLTDGTYNFTVDFPLDKYPAQSFKCVISKKDLGFKLRNVIDTGWALQNMQTQKMLVNNNKEVAANSAFSDMLSEVVSDSNLTKKQVVFAELPRDTTNRLTTDTGSVSSTIAAVDSGQVGFITDSIAQLQKISELQADTGTHMVFVDKTSGNADTISVFVPVDPGDDLLSQNVITGNNDSVVTQQADVSNSSANNDMVKTDTVASNENANALTDTAANRTATNPFYKPDENKQQANEIVSTDNNVANKSQPAEQQASKSVVTAAVKQDCRSLISDNDFDKLKRKMFVQDNSNDMIQAAVKFLNNKCLMTEQVKTLGNLFSSDDGRYNLYDALYNDVYDYGNYPSLESQILDPYYKRRFEAMLR